jgi:hypothetical protein
VPVEPEIFLDQNANFSAVAGTLTVPSAVRKWGGHTALVGSAVRDHLPAAFGALVDTAIVAVILGATADDFAFGARKDENAPRFLDSRIGFGGRDHGGEGVDDKTHKGKGEDDEVHRVGPW